MIANLNPQTKLPRLDLAGSFKTDALRKNGGSDISPHRSTRCTRAPRRGGAGRLLLGGARSSNATERGWTVYPARKRAGAVFGEIAVTRAAVTGDVKVLLNEKFSAALEDDRAVRINLTMAKNTSDERGMTPLFVKSVVRRFTGLAARSTVGAINLRQLASDYLITISKREPEDTTNWRISVRGSLEESFST